MRSARSCLPELFRISVFGFRICFVSRAHSEGEVEPLLACSPKNWLLSVSPEKPIQFLLPDLIFSGRGLVTRPIIVDDIT
jgi:hypothetical protein